MRRTGWLPLVLASLVQLALSADKVLTLEPREPGANGLAAASRNQKQLIRKLGAKPARGIFEIEKWRAEVRYLRNQVAAREKVVNAELVTNHGTLKAPIYTPQTSDQRREMSRLAQLKRMLKKQDDKDVDDLMYGGRQSGPVARSRLFVLLVRKMDQNRLDYESEWPLLSQLATTANFDLRKLEVLRHEQARSLRKAEHPAILPRELKAMTVLKEAQALEKLAGRDYKYEEIKRGVEKTEIVTLASGGAEEISAPLKLREKMANTVTDTKAESQRMKVVKLKARVATQRAEKKLAEVREQLKKEEEARAERRRARSASTLMQMQTSRRALSKFERIRPERLETLRLKKHLTSFENAERYALASFKLKGEIPLFSPVKGSPDRLALCSSMKRACSTPNVRCMCQHTCGTAKACGNTRKPAAHIVVKTAHVSKCETDALGDCKALKSACDDSPSVAAQCCKTCADEKQKQLDEQKARAHSLVKFDRSSREDREKVRNKKIEQETKDVANSISKLSNKNGADLNLATANISAMLAKPSGSIPVHGRSPVNSLERAKLAAEIEKLKHLASEATKPKSAEKASLDDIRLERQKILKKKAASKNLKAKNAEDKRKAQGGVKYRHGTVPWEDAVRSLPAASEGSRGNASPLPDEKA